MKFRRLTILDNPDFLSPAIPALSELSETEVVEQSADPQSVQEVLERIGDSDGAIVFLQTPITAEVIAQAPNLRYIGMFCAPFTDQAHSNVDLDAATKHSVVVSALDNCGNQATAEFVIWQMLGAARNNQIIWRGRPIELFEKSLGIIGLGEVGWEVAQRAKALGMNIMYSGPHEKPRAAAEGFRYVSTPDLLANSDVVTVHVPKGTRVLGEEELKNTKKDMLLINTSVGPTIDPNALRFWLKAGSGMAICDLDADRELAEIIRVSPRGFSYTESASAQDEVQQRRRTQLLENARAFLAGSPIRVVNG